MPLLGFLHARTMLFAATATRMKSDMLTSCRLGLWCRLRRKGHGLGLHHLKLRDLKSVDVLGVIACAHRNVPTGRYIPTVERRVLTK